MSLRSYLISGICLDEQLDIDKACIKADAVLKQHKMELEMDFSLRCRKEAIKDCIATLEEMYQRELK